MIPRIEHEVEGISADSRHNTQRGTRAEMRDQAKRTEANTEMSAVAQGHSQLFMRLVELEHVHLLFMTCDQFEE